MSVQIIEDCCRVFQNPLSAPRGRAWQAQFHAMAATMDPHNLIELLHHHLTAASTALISYLDQTTNPDRPTSKDDTR